MVVQEATLLEQCILKIGIDSIVHLDLVTSAGIRGCYQELDDGGKRAAQQSHSFICMGRMPVT